MIDRLCTHTHKSLVHNPHTHFVHPPILEVQENCDTATVIADHEVTGHVLLHLIVRVPGHDAFDGQQAQIAWSVEAIRHANEVEVVVRQRAAQLRFFASDGGR